MDKAKSNVFTIKAGLTGKARLFFSVLNHPRQTAQTLLEFGREHGEMEAKVADLKERLAEAIMENVKLKEKVYDMKHGGQA